MSYMHTYCPSVSRFLADEDGATAIEYALAASLIAVAIIAGTRSLGDTINSKFDDIATSIG
jgi:pilus assembly protein Flp/PilA